MPRRDFQMLWRGLVNIASSSQALEYEEEKEGSHGIHIAVVFPIYPRADRPPPEIPRANVRPVESVYVYQLASSCASYMII